MLIRSAYVLSCLLALVFATKSSAEIIYQQKSAYRNILVHKNDSKICMVFTLKNPTSYQSCMDLRDPYRLILDTSRMIFSALLITPKPERILVLGLGGGSISKTLQKLFPDAEIDISEIDIAVVKVAKEHFNFSESHNTKVTVGDARVFVKRARLAEKTYDLIILDVFDESYIPEHLMTREFLQEVNEILSPAGVLAANSFVQSRFYDHESVTYQSVWGKFFNLKTKNNGNRIIITPGFNASTANQMPDKKTLKKRAKALAHTLDPFGIDIRAYPELMSLEKDWKEDAEPLTDQYSPANLLKQIPNGQDIKKWMQVYGTHK